MAVNIGWTTETFGAENQSWLGSAHGTNECDTVTLDADKFVGTWADGIVPSGVVLGIVTGTGLAVPYTDAGTHGAGSETAAGFLFTTADLGVVGGVGQDVGAALFWHGEVVVASLPTNHGLTAAARVDLAGQVKFV